MADTLPAITNIQDEWINVYSALDIEVGVPLVIQNTGATTLIVRVQADEPDPMVQGRHLYPLKKETLNTGNSGLWVKNSPKSAGLSRLQVDIAGGLDETGFGLQLYPDSLQIQIKSSVNQPGEQTYLLVTNRTNAAIALDQIVNAQAFSQGNSEGTSVLSVLFIFNPNTTGATFLPSDTLAYANSYDGQFVNITGTGIEFNVLENVSDALNPDALRVVGGQVSFFQSNQGLTSSSLNGQVAFERPYSIGPDESIIISFINTPIVDGGTDALITGLIAGEFLTPSGQIEVATDFNQQDFRPGDFS